MKNFKYNRTGFTMLEFVMVIVVLGILAGAGVGSYDNNTRQQAADIILSDIRDTQHLALIDNKFVPTITNWQRAYWRIGFNFCDGSQNYYEYIGSDSQDYSTRINNNEAALDPLSGKIMNWITTENCDNGGKSNGATGISERIFLSYKYGINRIQFIGTSCSPAQYIGFDNLGRPYQGFTGRTSVSYTNRFRTPCTIKFTLDSGDDFSIRIEAETGYAHIVDQNNS
ncbi:MAG: type II secretion system protein [Sulfurovum sp.]